MNNITQGDVPAISGLARGAFRAQARKLEQANILNKATDALDRNQLPAPQVSYYCHQGCHIVDVHPFEQKTIVVRHPFTESYSAEPLPETFTEHHERAVQLDADPYDFGCSHNPDRHYCHALVKRDIELSPGEVHLTKTDDCPQPLAEFRRPEQPIPLSEPCH